METGNILCLKEADSTNLYAKRHFAELGHLAAVYTTSQTAGRGRLGRAWENAAGQGLYYTVVCKAPLAQPATLPLLSCMAVQEALRSCFGVGTRVKWPNDLLLNGGKLAGILCEGVGVNGAEGGFISGIGINLAQPQSYFEAAGLPHGTSLAIQGVPVHPGDAHRLAAALTAQFAARLPGFAQQGFAAVRREYLAACVNLGLPVRFAEGQGVARDVDENGNLVVETEGGEVRVFTGEVSVKGVYGAV